MVCSISSSILDDGERFQAEEIHLEQAESPSGSIEYWVTMPSWSSVVSGTYSDRSRSLMTTPAAWTPAWRETPSSVSAVIDERRVTVSSSS